MCLIAFAIDSHPRYSLVLVANRDEFRDRPTEPAGFWPDAPHVLAGRDGRAGGTWLGVTTGGKLAAITNYRDARYQVVHPPSRGLLVADYLRDEAMTTADLQAHLIRHGEEYDGFNLIYGTCRELHYFTNRGGSSGPVTPGVHALSNHLLDTSWPKVIAARAHLSTVVRQAEPGMEELFGLLADPAPFNSRLLPDTGIGPERERLLSPLFIEGEQYGTRSTTVITVDLEGRLTFVEQGMMLKRPGGHLLFRLVLILSRSLLPEDPQGLKEKVAEGRMRGQRCQANQHCPLTLALSFRPMGPHGEGINAGS